MFLLVLQQKLLNLYEHCINGSMVTSRPSYIQPSDISSSRGLKSFLWAEVHRKVSIAQSCNNYLSSFKVNVNDKNHLNLSDFFLILSLWSITTSISIFIIQIVVTMQKRILINKTYFSCLQMPITPVQLPNRRSYSYLIHLFFSCRSQQQPSYGACKSWAYLNNSLRNQITIRDFVENMLEHDCYKKANCL